MCGATGPDAGAIRNVCPRAKSSSIFQKVPQSDYTAGTRARPSVPCVQILCILEHPSYVPGIALRLEESGAQTLLVATACADHDARVWKVTQNVKALPVTIQVFRQSSSSFTILVV